MHKYLQVSPAGTQKNRARAKPNVCSANVSNALARYACAPPVPRLPTGNSRFSPHPSGLRLKPYRAGYRRRELPVAALALPGYYRKDGRRR
jgi:hypothetical protein